MKTFVNEKGYKVTQEVEEEIEVEDPGMPK